MPEIGFLEHGKPSVNHDDDDGNDGKGHKDEGGRSDHISHGTVSTVDDLALIISITIMFRPQQAQRTSLRT